MPDKPRQFMTDDEKSRSEIQKRNDENQRLAWDRQRDLDEARKRREEMQAEMLAQTRADFNIGAEEGKKLFGNYDPAIIADIMQRRKSALQGFSPEEMSAMRSQNVKMIDRTQQAQSRLLGQRQAQAGVRGATATAQQQTLSKDALTNRKDLERELFLQNMAEKRGALERLDTAQARERGGIMATQAGFASLGASQRNASLQAEAAKEYGEKQMQAANQGK
jgi:hypothetical protein